MMFYLRRALYTFFSSAPGKFTRKLHHILDNKTFQQMEIIQNIFDDHSEIKGIANNKKMFRKLNINLLYNL